MLTVRRDRLVDELRHADARFDRIVVDEMELRHRIEVQAARQLAAQETGRPREPAGCRLRGFLAGEMREADGRVREIRRHVDARDGDGSYARVLDLVLQEVGKLALNLVAHPVRTLRDSLHARLSYSVRDTSTISYTSSWSFGSMSLKFLIDRPHSKPALTSRTSSLKRFSESSSPSWMTTLSRSMRIRAPRRTRPSST